MKLYLIKSPYFKGFVKLFLESLGLTATWKTLFQVSRLDGESESFTVPVNLVTWTVIRKTTEVVGICAWIIYTRNVKTTLHRAIHQYLLTICSLTAKRNVLIDLNTRHLKTIDFAGYREADGEFHDYMHRVVYSNMHSDRENSPWSVNQWTQASLFPLEQTFLVCFLGS